MLGACIAVVLVVAWLALGGVHHESRAALHLGLGGCAVVAAALPASVLRKAGIVRSFGLAGATVWVACAVGLLPVPRGVLRLVSPGVADATAGGAYHALSLDPERTVGELAHLLLPLCTALVVCVWASAQPSRRLPWRAILGAAVAVSSVGLAHALSGEPALFGVVETSMQAHLVYWAPFIDPNHFGTLIVALLPTAAWVALQPGEERSTRWVAGALTVGLSVLLLGVRSHGAVLAGTVVLAATVVTAGGWRHRVVLGGTVLGLLAAVVTIARAPLLGATLGGRLEMWADALRVLRSSWLTGTGGGTFAVAVQPEHTAFNHWTHAHNDLVEWGLETGLVGSVALVAAGAWLWPGAERSRSGGTPLLLGVVGVGIHALMDFPFQIPIIAMTCAALWALRRGQCERRTRIAPAEVRGWLLGAMVLSLAAAAWEARSGAVERAAQTLRVARTQGAAEATLQRLAPWRPELELSEGWRSQRAGDGTAAAAFAMNVVVSNAHDAGALRRAALLLDEAGDRPGAREALLRARHRYPGDWRAAVHQARLTEDREAALLAWQDAFRVGAPPSLMDEAWMIMPIGVAWVDVAEQSGPKFLSYLGSFLARAGDSETALIAFDRALVLDQHAKPRPGYVRLLIESGRLEDARRLVDSESTQVADMSLRAQLLEAFGERGEAAEIWQQLAQRSPGLGAKAIRAVEQLDGSEAALTLALELSERDGLDDRATLELARLRRDRGELALCLVVLDQESLRRGPLEASAERLRRSCR